MEKDTRLVDIDVVVPVSKVADANHGIFQIRSDKLLLDKGQIFTVPMQLYTVKDGEVEISELLNDPHDVLRRNLEKEDQIEDDSWALLLEGNEDYNEIEKLMPESTNDCDEMTANTSGASSLKRKTRREIPTSSKKPRICESEEEADSNDDLGDETTLESSTSVQLHAPNDTCSSSSDSVVSALPKPVYDPLNLAEVENGSWVLVQYGGKDFLGVVKAVHPGHCRVQCLSRPYGYRLAQEFEKECDSLDYTEVYKAPICPWTSELDDQGNRTRKTYYKY